MPVAILKGIARPLSLRKKSPGEEVAISKALHGLCHGRITEGLYRVVWLQFLRHCTAFVTGAPVGVEVAGDPLQF